MFLLSPSSYRRRSDGKASGKMAPIITNTTLNVCRLFGKSMTNCSKFQRPLMILFWPFLFPGRYVQMMTVLKPIAFDVMICMSQLFDFYLYTVRCNEILLHLL
jgi:hypothetical protein